MSSALTMWTVYGPTTSDHPGKWVVRAFDIVVDGAVARHMCTLHDSLELARCDGVPKHLACLQRSPGDDPTIIETWI